jgi:hypothetical protein
LKVPRLSFFNSHTTRSLWFTLISKCISHQLYHHQEDVMSASSSCHRHRVLFELDLITAWTSELDRVKQSTSSHQSQAIELKSSNLSCQSCSIDLDPSNLCRQQHINVATSINGYRHNFCIFITTIFAFHHRSTTHPFLPSSAQQAHHGSPCRYLQDQNPT